MTAKPRLSLPLYQGDPHPCSYLPDRIARHEYVFPSRIEPGAYQWLMDQSFRRSGRLIYRPACDGCRECIPIRVPVATFRPTKSQRRAWRKNADVEVQMGPPVLTDEKWAMYSAYLKFQHDRHDDSRQDLEQFLYNSSTDTVEMTLSIAGRVIGASILDACPDSLSSVYFYFDPAEAKRSLGVFSALAEIDACVKLNLKWWYAGFYIRNCDRMNYKANFGPYELLGQDFVWRAAGESPEE